MDSAEDVIDFKGGLSLDYCMLLLVADVISVQSPDL